MTILVYIDYIPQNRQPRTESIALSEIAHKLGSELNENVEAVVINSVVVSSKIRDYKIFSRIYNIRIKNVPEGIYNPVVFSEALYRFCKSRSDISIILFPATLRCREIAPYVAAKLETGLVADISELYVDEKKEVIAVKPSFGENVLAHIYIPDRKPKMFTVRTSMRKIKTEYYSSSEIVHEEVDVPSEILQCIEYVKSSQMYDPDSDLLPEKHDIVIGVGAGVNRELIDTVKAIARKLNVGIAATKKVTDRGLLSTKFLVGESGKIIRPRIYIALGISGAPQHMTGIKDCEMLVSVNIDEKAPIVKYSTYLIKCDVNELIRKLADLVLK